MDSGIASAERMLVLYVEATGSFNTLSKSDIPQNVAQAVVRRLTTWCDIHTHENFLSDLIYQILEQQRFHALITHVPYKPGDSITPYTFAVAKLQQLSSIYPEMPIIAFTAALESVLPTQQMLDAGARSVVRHPAPNHNGKYVEMLEEALKRQLGLAVKQVVA